MIRAIATLALASSLAACATLPQAAPQDRFWQALTSHCGKAYAGGLVSNEAVDAEMRGVAMVMHLRRCSAERIEVPFHVERQDGSWDRSRTWLITRTGSGLRLKHDHRHEDGKPDATTMYGGDTADAGSARSQDFPVDAESQALFRREQRDVSLTNVWRVEVDAGGTPNASFAYRLLRQAPNARNFHVAFDLTVPVAPPPAPWGHE